jgi:hypothetical protein
MVLPSNLVMPYESLRRWWENEKSIVLTPICPSRNTMLKCSDYRLICKCIFMLYVCRCLYWCIRNVCACVSAAGQVRLISTGHTNIDKDLLFVTPNDNGKVCFSIESYAYFLSVLWDWHIIFFMFIYCFIIYYTYFLLNNYCIHASIKIFTSLKKYFKYTK